MASFKSVGVHSLSFHTALPYTNIIPCKTPLDARFHKYMDSEEQSLELPSLLASVHEKGFHPVRYVVDLNRGRHYYYPTEGFGSTMVVEHFAENIQERAHLEPEPFSSKWPSFPKLSYIKMALPRTSAANPGSMEDAYVFEKELEQLLLYDSRIECTPVEELIEGMEEINASVKFDYYVLVHCVHGSNRTGFALSYFLAKKFGMPVEHAIRIFESARGEPIKRKAVKQNLKDNYVDDLSSSTLATEGDP